MSIVGNHSQLPPESWTHLTDTLENGSMEGALRAATQLEGRDLEAARYYGFGLIICQLARKLHDPEVKEQIIDANSQILTNIATLGTDDEGKDKTRPISRHLIELAAFDQTIKPYVLDAYNTVGQPTNRLIDGLSAIAIAAKDQRFHDRSSWLERAIMYAQNEPEDSLTVLEVSSGMHASAKRVIVNISQALHRSLPPEQKSDRLECEAEIEEGFDEEILMSNGVLRALRQLARYRLVETGGLTKYDITFTNDSVKIHPDTFPSKPIDLQPREIRTERLGCPALHVSGMIQIAQDLTVRSIARALERKAAQPATN